VEAYAQIAKEAGFAPFYYSFSLQNIPILHGFFCGKETHHICVGKKKIRGASCDYGSTVVS
jgi:hypothetical protein